MADDPDAPITRTADEARGGVVVLRHRIARIVFVSALVGIVIVTVAGQG
jgi:hypothetical protein